MKFRRSETLKFPDGQTRTIDPTRYGVLAPDVRRIQYSGRKRWRYRLFSIAGKLTVSARRKMLLVPGAAPEANPFTALTEGAEQLWQRWRNGHLTA